jgi:hypothetical protein
MVLVRDIKEPFFLTKSGSFLVLSIHNQKQQICYLFKQDLQPLPVMPPTMQPPPTAYSNTVFPGNTPALLAATHFNRDEKL